MRIHLVPCFLGALSTILAGVSKADDQSGQVCAAVCWKNSEYVSDCAGDLDCLCKDEEFQNAVYQCIYVQCPTAYFGPALHSALAMCSTDTISTPMPQLIRRETVRKRDTYPPIHGSAVNSVYAPASRSGHFRSVTLSASASARPTKSVHRGSALASASASRSVYRQKRSQPTPA